MASAWDVPAVGWAIIVVGWWISPVIAFFLPKIFSYLELDVSQKVRELEFVIIPDLENTLRAVDQERMLDRGKKAKSDVAALDKMAAMLRHAREDAEDIFDDHHHIELYRNRCWQRLYGTVKACIVLSQFEDNLLGHDLPHFMTLMHELIHKLGHSLYDTVATCKSSFVWLLQWARKIVALGRSTDVLPVTTRSDAPADDTIPATSSAGASNEPPVWVTAASDSSGWCLAYLCTYFDLIKNWLAIAFGFVWFLRDWSYEVVGITSYQENATALYFLVTAIARRSLKKRIEKLERTIGEVKKSTLLGVACKSAADDIANQNRSKIRTSSNRKVFGREALRDSIMAKLRENPHSTSPCYSAIGIYGVAGSGKTTFARYTRDYIEKICKEEKLFHAIMCIHVSETFSVDDIFHEMLKDITKDRNSNISDHEELEEKLKESLCGKRFCLILDDLWVKSRNDPLLEELISPLNVALKGSKILVTARTKVAAGSLCVDEPMEMPDLDEDQYLSMFMHYALGGTSVADEEFKQVGRVIAEKLHGSPIAAVIVAGRLGANRDIKFWKNTAQLDMLNDNMDSLWWSYQQLSSDIRRCFQYCNIFPRTIKMKKSNLVHLWIAQGFIKTSCAREDMEDVAEGYIQELVSCSFLQPEKTRKDEESFRIHDLLHDLADMVTGTDCFRIENERSLRGEIWNGDIPRDVRHLFIQNYDAELITQEILGLGNLRTLIINVYGRDTQVEEKVIDNICKKLPKLRVLAFAKSIKAPKKLSIPESINQLKYLRYLAFRTNRFCKIILPSTVNKLRHIQLLDFGNGNIFEFTFDELVNLRHIFCWPHVKLAYVGRLSSLQTLPVFKVSNEQGCELKQLRDLNKLRGRLEIDGLENVKSKEETLQANLAAKRLTELTLQWGYSDHTRGSPKVEADILEGLCTSAGLKKLELWYFAGWRYLDWMVGKQNSGPKDLQELYIVQCSKPVHASGFPKAFPHLRLLKLWWCSWDALPEDMEHLTSLKELVISSCWNIRLLPKLPRSLEVFELRFCNTDFMKSCQILGHANWQKIKHIPRKFFC